MYMHKLIIPMQWGYVEEIETIKHIAIARVHNKNREGECLTRTLSAKITAYVRGYP